MVDQERLANLFRNFARIDSPSNEMDDLATHLDDRLGRLRLQVEQAPAATGDGYSAMAVSPTGNCPRSRGHGGRCAHRTTRI